MFRLSCAVATLAFLGLIPMATAALVVALIGVGLASLALYQLNRRAVEVSEQAERDLMAAGGDRHHEG